MLTILKAEIEYFKVLILAIVLLPLLFTVLAINDVLLFQNVYFLKKYFWSVVVGLGIYAVVFMIWSLRKKEMREREHMLLPISIKGITLNRWLFGVAPFILVGGYLEMVKDYLPAQQIVFVERINGQLGVLFIVLVVFDLLINASFAITQVSYFKRKLLLAGIFVVLLFTTIAAINFVSSSQIKPLSTGGEEIFFFVWGFIISVIDALVFIKRKIFLG